VNPQLPGPKSHDPFSIDLYEPFGAAARAVRPLARNRRRAPIMAPDRRAYHGAIADRERVQ
jgi:hypothetical protein